MKQSIIICRKRSVPSETSPDQIETQLPALGLQFGVGNNKFDCRFCMCTQKQYHELQRGVVTLAALHCFSSRIQRLDNHHSRLLTFLKQLAGCPDLAHHSNPRRLSKPQVQECVPHVPQSRLRICFVWVLGEISIKIATHLQIQLTEELVFTRKIGEQAALGNACSF